MSKFSDEADDYDLVYRHQTPAAYLFRIDPTDSLDEVWLPKSQVEADFRGEPVVGRTYTVTVPNWLAEEKGLV